MLRSSRSTLLRYGGAIAAVIVATVARMALNPVLENLIPFATMFLAVVVVAGYAGRGPALLTTGLGAVVSARFLLTHREGLAIRGVEIQVGMALYLAVSLGIALLGGTMQVTRRHAKASAAEAVREWERLRSTLSSIGDAILVTDAEGRVTSLNPVAEALTGWPSPEAAGQPLPSVFHIVDEVTRRELEIPAVRALREGANIGLANHTVLIARDGTERPIDDCAAPIRDDQGRVSGAVLSFRDVTERRQQEKLLRDSEQRARTILESITDAFFALDRDWRFTYVNPQAERVLGRTPGELLGKSLWEENPGLLGSEFAVRLPILPVTGEVRAPARDQRGGSAERPPRRRILVVDDNIAAKSLERLLERLHGQEVRVAHDGPEALAVAGEFRPEVVLLDIGLPGMSGYEVAEQLRGLPEFDGTLIVALTGWGQEDDRRRSRGAGIDHHLVKPVDPEALTRLLATPLLNPD